MNTKKVAAVLMFLVALGMGRAEADPSIWSSTTWMWYNKSTSLQTQLSNLIAARLSCADDTCRHLYATQIFSLKNQFSYANDAFMCSQKHDDNIAAKGRWHMPECGEY